LRKEFAFHLDLKKVSSEINIFFILSILWTLIIFYFSIQPASVSRKQSGEILVKAKIISEDEIQPENQEASRAGYIFHAQNLIRKTAHLIEYFVLGLLICCGFLRNMLHKKLKKDIYIKDIYIKKNIICGLNTLWICILVAACDEFIQKFIPGRGPGLKDVLIDTAGTASGITIVLIVNLLLYYIKGSTHKLKTKG